MISLPTISELYDISKAVHWGGEQAISPTGITYWRYMIFKHVNKHAYVLENHWEEESGNWKVKQVVKLLW